MEKNIGPYTKKQKDRIVIKSNRLMVEILHPGKVYNGTRFDWTGFIEQVTLDQKNTFCVPESYIEGKGTGGSGMCNEYGIFQATGYDEVPAGGFFPKFGVGLLKKPDNKPYEFFKIHEVEPFEMNTVQDEEWIEFSTESKICSGYAARVTKKISVQDNTLTINYCFQNTGEKRIITHEYCHNFIGINGHNIGTDYELKFPYPVKTQEEKADMILEDQRILWERIPQKDFYCRLKDFKNTGNHHWELVHKPSGIGMREITEFDIKMIAVWGSAHVVSPEIFIHIDLNPGEEKKWSRRFEFFC